MSFGGQPGVSSNLMTEDEAHTKACPVATTRSYILVPNPENLTKEDFDMISQNLKCQASGCMAWRWAFPGIPMDREGTGFCGLSGRPVEVRS